MVFLCLDFKIWSMFGARSEDAARSEERAGCERKASELESRKLTLYP